MHKVILSFVLFILSSVVALGQYADNQSIDVTTTKAYKAATTTFYSGLAVGGVGAAVCAVGNVVCVIEQNKYTNSHATSWTIEEIYNLNQEAKQQTAYKVGLALGIGGFVGILAGTGISLLGLTKMNKLKNASGETVAILEYTPTGNGITLALRF